MFNIPFIKEHLYGLDVSDLPVPIQDMIKGEIGLKECGSAHDHVYDHYSDQPAYEDVHDHWSDSD